MPESIESRRRAVAEALRRDASEARMATLGRRLNLVEAVVFDSTWDAPGVAPAGDDTASDVTPSVPALSLGDVRMSSAAAQALFGS